MKGTAKLGFSLIELLVVIAILGILASIAYPSYQSHVQQTRRTEAQALLMEAALEQESYRITSAQYAASMSVLLGSTSNSHYDFSVTSSGATTYKLKASAKTGSTQLSDKEGSVNCKDMTINQSDVKTPSTCW